MCTDTSARRPLVSSHTHSYAVGVASETGEMATVMRPGRVTGKVVLVTGAAQGIGNAAAKVSVRVRRAIDPASYCKTSTTRT